MGQPTLLHCDAVRRGGVREGTMPLAQLSAGFQSFPHYLQVNWALLVLDLSGWFYVHSRPSGLSCEAWNFSCCCNSHRIFFFIVVQVQFSAFFLCPSPYRIFIARGFEAYFLCWNPGLCSLSCSPVVLPGLSACECGTIWCVWRLLSEE